MPRKSVTLVFVIALIAFAPGKLVMAQNADATADNSGTTTDVDRLLAEGKAIFADKCARCHNENGDKPLSTGSPLNQRALSTDKIAQAVNGRLRGRTDDERHAVTLYIASLMENKGSAAK